MPFSTQSITKPLKVFDLTGVKTWLMHGLVAKAPPINFCEILGLHKQPNALSGSTIGPQAGPRYIVGNPSLNGRSTDS